MSDLEAIEIGMPAPGFTLTATSAEPVNLSDYRGKSPVVVFFMREFI